MGIPLWLQAIAVLVWGAASFPLFYWSVHRCRIWKVMLVDQEADFRNQSKFTENASFTLIMMIGMFAIAAALIFGMAFAMHETAGLLWRSAPTGEYFSRPGIWAYVLFVMIPAIAASVAPLDSIGRRVFRSNYQQLFVQSARQGGSLKSARYSSIFLCWANWVAWVVLLVAFAGSLRWFTWVGEDRVVIGRPWKGSARVVTPGDIRVVYGVESFRAPAGNLVVHYHPVIEFSSTDYVEFSGEAGGKPERLARVLEAWSGRHGVSFTRLPIYPP
jgi:hypothetical protein